MIHILSESPCTRRRSFSCKMVSLRSTRFLNAFVLFAWNDLISGKYSGLWMDSARFKKRHLVIFKESLLPIWLANEMGREQLEKKNFTTDFWRENWSWFLKRVSFSQIVKVNLKEVHRRERYGYNKKIKKQRKLNAVQILSTKLFV